MRVSQPLVALMRGRPKLLRQHRDPVREALVNDLAGRYYGAYRIGKVSHANTLQEMSQTKIVPIALAVFIFGGIGFVLVQLFQHRVDLRQHLRLDDVSWCVCDTKKLVRKLQSRQAETIPLVLEFAGLSCDEFLFTVSTLAP